MIQALRAARDYDVTPILPMITCPVLLVWGEEDSITPVTNWEQHLHLFKNGRLVKIAGAGHSPQVERPQKFAEIVLDFLRGQS
jgi:pimeloyl-ACP methyl ester carboxylesterase